MHALLTLTALVARAFTAGTWVHDMLPAAWLDCFHATCTSRFMCGSCLLLPAHVPTLCPLRVGNAHTSLGWCVACL